MKQYVVLILFASLSISLSKAMEKNNENISPNLPLSQKREGFPELRKRAQGCLDKADIKELYQVFEEASTASTQGENFYEEQCKQHNITKWPSQTTFKEAYLGEAFYPKREIDLFYEHDTNVYLLLRFDVLWSLAMSSKFNNPVALYYLGRGLEKHINDVADWDIDYIIDLYEKAFENLEMLEGNKDVYFLMASDYDAPRYGYRFDREKAFELYKLADNAEAQLQMLLTRSVCTGYEKPELEDYLQLAENYPKAYVMALRFLEDTNKKIEFLTQSHEKGYIPSFLELGLLYAQNNEKEKAIQFFEKYGEKGYPIGYINCSIFYTGNIILKPAIYKQAPGEELKLAMGYLEKAYNLHHPEASYYLGIICLEMFNRTKNQEFKEKAALALNKAYNLGEMGACAYFDNLNGFECLEEEINRILTFIE